MFASWMSGANREHGSIVFVEDFSRKRGALVGMNAKQGWDAQRDMLKMLCVCHEIVSHQSVSNKVGLHANPWLGG